MVLANPKVSICIFTQGFTDETFLSFKNLAFDANLMPDFEVLIVCDESGLDDWAKTVLSAFNLDLQVVKTPSGDPVSARYIAAEQARGEVLIFCDSKVVLTVDALLQCTSVATGELSAPRILPLHANNRVSQFFSEFVLNPCAENGTKFTETATWAMARSDFLEVARLQHSVDHRDGENQEFLRNWVTSGRSLRFLETARVFHRNPTTIRGLIKGAASYGRQSLLSSRVGMTRDQKNELKKPPEQVFSPDLSEWGKSIRTFAIKSTKYAWRLRESERVAHLARRLVTWPAVIAAEVVARIFRRLATPRAQSLRDLHVQRIILAWFWFLAWNYGSAQGSLRRTRRFT